MLTHYLYIDTAVSHVPELLVRLQSKCLVEIILTILQPKFRMNMFMMYWKLYGFRECCAVIDTEKFLRNAKKHLTTEYEQNHLMLCLS